MLQRFQRNWLAGALALLLAAFASTAHGQGVTTSGINGRVIDQNGHPVTSATVAIVQRATGARINSTTGSTGQYDVSGLQIGGPYTVTVTGGGMAPVVKNDIYITLDQEQTVDFNLSSEVVQMETFNVSESSDPTFAPGKMGTSTNFSSAEISVVPTVRRDVQDVARLDPRITLIAGQGVPEFALSAQGQNSRYNSFLVDGVSSNDPFGLNQNGFSSLRSPVPLDFLQALTVDLNPYDVSFTGFTGALINTVMKSGTNEFHGDAYTYYTGKSLRGENPVTGQKEQLQEHTYGASVGGPILKDRLFFFFGYEDYKRTNAAPTQVFLPDPAVTAAVIAAAKAYGYDPGSASPSATISTQKSYVGKLDWNISDSQRATLSYRRTDSSTPTFADFNGSAYTSLSNHWYQSNRISDNYTLQLNSSWTPDFHTEASATYAKYNGTATPNGSPFPEIYINGLTGTSTATGATITGQYDLGTNYSYQLNALVTSEIKGYLYGDYVIGNHTIKFGGDSDKNLYLDKFVQYYYGRYAFDNLAAFVAGNAEYFRYQQPTAGYTIPSSFAQYSFTDFGALVQDTWRPNNGLAVNLGLRFDYPYIPGKPPFSQSFYTAFGFKNNTTGTGNDVVEPRLGFNYRLPTAAKVQVRGGIGLFQGTNPAVWIGNAFDTAGALNTVQLGSSTTSTTGATVATFNPNPNYAQTLPLAGTPTPGIDIIDPSFKTPLSWKGNLAVDYTLPWLGLIATAEADYIVVDEAITYKSLNLLAAGTLPDGRTFYKGTQHSNFSQVLDITNTKQGGSQTYTLGLHRSLKNHWAASLYYTHTHATDVQPLTSSVATSNYNYRPIYDDPNSTVAHTSTYEIPENYVATLTYEFNFFKRKGSATRLSGIFRAQTGHAYSWVFASDLIGAGNGSSTFNNSFYVPTGPNDPKVVWSDITQEANFFNYVKGTDLKNYMGRIVPPNSSFNPWQKTIDLHLEQDIPLYWHARLSVFADITNFANLLNKKSGGIDGIDFGTGYNGYNREVAGATINASNQYVYTFTPTTLTPSIKFTDYDRYQIQLGLKLDF